MPGTLASVNLYKTVKLWHLKTISNLIRYQKPNVPSHLHLIFALKLTSSKTVFKDFTNTLRAVPTDDFWKSI